MKKLFFTLFLSGLSFWFSTPASAQCTWQTLLSDGFEYQTVCPDLIPGKTVHNIPQAFAVYSGSYSLYMNFKNCVTGSGCCAGDTVYLRTITCCKNMPLRFSAWLTTSFSGLQCNMRIIIFDGDFTVLNDQTSISAAYYPSWTQYTSGSVTPAYEYVYFMMITNVGGGNGNDLSMDDFLVENCYPNSTTTNANVHLCANVPQYHLIDFVPAPPDSTGIWTGPSTPGGGYLGIYNTGSSPVGSYSYVSPYYGTGSACPITTNVLAVSIAQPPVINLPADTLACATATVVLTAGTAAGWTYHWSSGSTSSTLNATTSLPGGEVKQYSVTVTDANGCINHKTVTVTFVVCTGINDPPGAEDMKVYPNPAFDRLNISLVNPAPAVVEIYDLSSRVLIREHFGQSFSLDISTLAQGIYFYKVVTKSGMIRQGKILKN